MKDTMRKNSMIVKHNSLIRSRYDYSMAELRIILSIASMVNKKDDDFEEYSVNAGDYAKMMKANKQNQITLLKNLGRSLMSKPLEIPQEDGILICNWFSSYRYIDGECRIVCTFDPKLKPYMLHLKEEFTQYKLENILKMKSVYAIRLYEIAKSWENRGSFTVTVENFKNMFGISDKYKMYADFKKKVILKAVLEINTHTDIEISFKERKKERKIVSLDFRIVSKIDKKVILERSVVIEDSENNTFCDNF